MRFLSLSLSITQKAPVVYSFINIAISSLKIETDVKVADGEKRARTLTTLDINISYGKCYNTTVNNYRKNNKALMYAKEEKHETGLSI